MVFGAQGRVEGSGAQFLDSWNCVSLSTIVHLCSLRFVTLSGNAGSILCDARFASPSTKIHADCIIYIYVYIHICICKKTCIDVAS